MTDTISTQQRRPGMNGWVEAGLFVVAISLLNIVYTMASQSGVHVVAFVIYAMLFASIIMLAFTGLGQDWLDVIVAPASWIFGVSAVALEATYFLLLAYMPPAEATLTVRLTVPISVLIGWAFFSRRLDRWMILGIAIIIAAVVPLFYGLPENGIWYAVTLGVACSTAVSIKTFSSEFHPWNRRAQTVSEKMRITGLVVLATTVLLLVTVTFGRLIINTGVVANTNMIPTLQDFISFKAFWLGALVGAPLLVAMNYLTFSSVVKIRTENFLAMSAFTPLIAWSMQIAAEALSLISTTPMGWRLLPLTAVGIIGVFIVIWAGRGQGETD